MGKLERSLFIIFVMIIQLLQFALVLGIAYLNNSIVEFVAIFFSFQFNRMLFGKSYHADKISKCTLLTLVIFYFLIKGVLGVNISIFVAPLFGVYLSYLLSLAQDLIDNQKKSIPFYKKRLREQILEILGDRLDEEDIEEYCTTIGVNPKVSETVFLYLSNSKDDVSNILDINGTTVIRRLKHFIDKATT